MTTPNWFRSKTWSAADAAEFERGLARARGQRSEYLRIQALTLAEIHDPLLADSAIALARRHLSDYPDSPFRAQMLCTMARACATKQDESAAIDAYRLAIEADRRGNTRCGASLQFAWFVVTRDLTELHEEALGVMESSVNEDDLAFPAVQYCYFGALALISEAREDSEFSARMARNAVEAARRKRGPFPRHPTVGLVEDADPAVLRRIERLAG